MRAITAMHWAARALLQHDHDNEHGDEEHLDEVAGEAHEDVDTLPLRIAAVFVIFAAALIFGLPTLFLRHFQTVEHVVGRIARTFAGGIILGLALIHIIPEAIEELHELTSFHHLGGVTVLFGILALVILDNALLAAFAPKSLAGHAHAHTHAPGTKGAMAVAENASHSDHAHQCLSNVHAQHVGAAAAVQSEQKHTHAHGVAANAPQSTLAVMRQKVAAYSMELGCIFHSVIIGVGVGVIVDDRQLVVTLIVALAIHQGLEALALGSVLASIRAFSLFKKLTMLAVYAITTPIGIAIGIAVAASYDPESVTSRAVQGTINGISGGMLLYIGMFQLVGEEFSREDMLQRTRLRWGMYAALLLGAAVMSVLAIWA